MTVEEMQTSGYYHIKVFQVGELDQMVQLLAMGWEWVACIEGRCILRKRNVFWGHSDPKKGGLKWA